MSSKKLRPILIASLIGLALGLPGCALLGLDGSSPDENLDMTDPIVRAALSVRSSDYRSSMSRRPSSLDQGRQNRDVVPGMDMRDVRAVLGEPLSIDTAGSDNDGNQRWVYSDGYRGELNNGPSRIVYFENGRVAGWRNYDSH